MADTRQQITTMRERISTSDDISDADREQLLAFSNRLDVLDGQYSDLRHLKLLSHCTNMAEHVGGLAEALTDRTTAEKLVRWIKREYDNEYTKKDFRVALRMFGEHVTEGEGKPPSIDWIPSSTSNSHNPVPNPANMLDWEDDVLPMIEDGTHNARDAALIAVAFDAGARSGELKALTIGDVSDHRHGLQIMVDGKTGQRSVTLVPSVPYLNRWLTDHPAPDRHDAPLWSKLSTPAAISKRKFLDCFKDAAARVGVTKPVTPTNFRKSNATFLARRGMNQAFIEDRQGRKRGSDATAHYVARFGGENDDEYARLHGVEVETPDPEPIGPRTCPRCEKETPRHSDTCVWCRQPLDYDGIESIRADEREVRDAALRIVQDNPDLLDDYQQARDLTTLFEENPQLFDDARRFAEALDSG